MFVFSIGLHKWDCIVLSRFISAKNCVGYAIDFKQMSEIVSQRGNEFPHLCSPYERTSASGQRSGCTGCTGSSTSVMQGLEYSVRLWMCEMSFGATAALGCRQDRETDGFYLQRVMRLIWYPLHNTIIDSLIVLPLLAGLWCGGVMGPYFCTVTCSNQSLLTSG